HLPPPSAFHSCFPRGGSLRHGSSFGSSSIPHCNEGSVEPLHPAAHRFVHKSPLSRLPYTVGECVHVRDTQTTLPRGGSKPGTHEPHRLQALQKLLVASDGEPVRPQCLTPI
ncbi:unnamed protein product, partial [Trichogramma brassicae]